MALSRREKLYVWWLWRRRQRIQRCKRFGVHPINRSRRQHGAYYHLKPDLLKHKQKFVDYVRMTPDKYKALLDLCAADLEKYTNFRQPISADERLLLALRFLATGDSFRSLAFQFRLGFTTVRNIIREALQVLWNNLQSLHMPVPDETIWRKSAETFFQKWNFPLCVGAIDGKHVQVKAPAHSGSLYFNYKHHFSIVLMAVVDADGLFLVVDVGSHGSGSDSGIITDTTFYKLLRRKKLGLPQPENIPNTDTELPHVFVADEAFALTQNVMRPFPRRQLNNARRIFNYRLSRARRQVECTFGIASRMWRVLRKPMEVDPEFATDIVKAVCVLHNYIQKGGSECRSLPLTDNEGEWEDIPTANARPAKDATSVRDAFMSYFLSAAGSLSWQNDWLS